MIIGQPARVVIIGKTVYTHEISGGNDRHDYPGTRARSYSGIKARLTLSQSNDVSGTGSCWCEYSSSPIIHNDTVMFDHHGHGVTSNPVPCTAVRIPPAGTRS